MRRTNLAVLAIALFVSQIAGECYCAAGPEAGQTATRVSGEENCGAETSDVQEVVRHGIVLPVAADQTKMSRSTWRAPIEVQLLLPRTPQPAWAAFHSRQAVRCDSWSPALDALRV